LDIEYIIGCTNLFCIKVINNDFPTMCHGKSSFQSLYSCFNIFSRKKNCRYLLCFSSNHRIRHVPQVIPTSSHWLLLLLLHWEACQHHNNDNIYSHSGRNP
jgi:hypothetical protein